MQTTDVAKALHLDKSAASRRVQAAITRGYLLNLETRLGQPAQLILGDPLPEDQEILPTVEALARRCTSVSDGEAPGHAQPVEERSLTPSGCTVAAVPEETTSPSPSVKDSNSEQGLDPIDNAMHDRMEREYNAEIRARRSRQVV